MLDQQIKSQYGAENKVPEVQQALLIDLTEGFNKELQRQADMIIRIQNKLYNILNPSSPEKPNDDISVDMPDLVSKLRFLQDGLEKNNISLERIIKHLSIII